jgi:hypothetical protein
MLLKVTYSNPWYANIMNFMVSGYVPLGEIGRSYCTRADAPCAMIFTYTKYGQMVCSEDACQHLKESKSLKNATLHHMEATMVISHPSENMAKWVLLAINV